ncbi:MAG: hypothetical protein KZY74_02345, partial [Paenibacillaceae bacterium]|nr:hypothetical protein [Paenibacillaceae bacterium]
IEFQNKRSEAHSRIRQFLACVVCFFAFRKKVISYMATGVYQVRQIGEEPQGGNYGKRGIPHDEAFKKESETIMEFMPSWMRQGYEKGLEEGMEKGIAQGTLIERQHVARRLLSKGFSPKEVADTLQIPIEEINKIIN